MRSSHRVGSTSNPKLSSRTTKGRRLVEDYWRSVLHSKTEPPLYHTFSDRYGGTKGIPFAARTDCSSVLLAAGLRLRPANLSLDDCVARADVALEEGNYVEARDLLKHALVHFQNLEGGLTIAALTVACGNAPEKMDRSTQVADVLRKLGKVSLLSDQVDEALELFNQSLHADPLVPDTYLLRAACFERLGQARAAYDEFEKYLKLNTPTLKVLAHCGKCAVEAGALNAAEGHLVQLLDLAKLMSARAHTEEDSSAMEQAAFYTAHANFYLGCLCELQAEAARPTLLDTREFLQLSERAHAYFEAAVANSMFMESYECGVDNAVAAGDYAFALHLLRHLQQMQPNNADHCLHAAHIYHMGNNPAGEVAALSDALDRAQSFSARRLTLLTRGTVHSEILGNIERAIKDFTLVIGLPRDEPLDHYTPLAFLKRAEAFRMRFGLSGSREDDEAALSDYQHFLQVLEEPGGSAQFGSLPSPGDEHTGAGAVEACHLHAVTEALLILANGAFHRKRFSEAVSFFARAINRGWCPTPLLLHGELDDNVAQDVAHPAERRMPFIKESLFDQMFIALAHHVIALYPPSEEAFRVPYENPEFPVTNSFSMADVKKLKSAEKRETERLSLASPSLSYSLVDARYCAMRALEPTMFSSLEGAFLEIWEPYRTEIERIREELMSTRNRRWKRNAV